MAFDPQFKMSIQDANGDYYIAQQNNDGSWYVNTTPAGFGIQYLDSLPNGWDQTEIKWERDTTYFGVFRSQSNTFGFSTDGRAILKSILYSDGGSIQGYAVLTIWMWNEATFGYDIFYQSNIDYAKGEDDGQNELFTAGTIDSELYELLMAWGSTEFNIPYWTAIGMDWSTDALGIQHTGIKLLYSASFTSGASATNPIFPTATGPAVFLYGFNQGSISNGRHWLPAMSNYNIVQNNGTTTYIGNDILQPFLIQGSQSQNYEQNFWGTDESRPYSRNAALITNLLNNSAGYVDISVTLSGTWGSDISHETFLTFHEQFVGFVLFEINQQDYPEGITGNPAAGNMQYIRLYHVDLPTDIGTIHVNGTSFSSTTNIQLKYQHSYVLGIIYDNATPGDGISGHALTANIMLSALDINFSSNYNSGSADPVNAPSFPASPVLAFRPAQVLQKLVPCLNSSQTDAFGFPIIPAGTPYAGVSDYLSDETIDPATNFDNVPANTAWTSKTALQDLPGQPYISLSINDYFNVCFKTWAAGLGIEGNNIRIERLSYFFNDTMILDLGTNVYGLKVKILDSIMYADIQAGYATQDTNNDFGIENVWNEQDYTTPLTRAPQTEDLMNASAMANIYAIEKARAQQVNSALPVSGSSGGNDNILIELGPPAADPSLTPFVDPSNHIHEPVGVYSLKQYANAQNSDPTAATAPFINGMYYPETGYNYGITPAKNFLRLGSYVHSLCDNLAENYITFRKQYQMQFNGTALELPGISTNLYSGLINEVADFKIGNLPAQLFRPYILSFTSDYPVTMYLQMNSNPRGYVQLKWNNGKSYNSQLLKGYIWKVSQKAGNGAPTEWELLLHPSITNDMLKAI